MHFSLWLQRSTENFGSGYSYSLVFLSRDRVESCVVLTLLKLQRAIILWLLYNHQEESRTIMIIRSSGWFTMNITKRDVKYVVEQSHVLRMLGIWPLIDRRSNMIEKVINIFLVIICYLLLHCDMVPGVLYYMFVDNGTREQMKMMLMPPILYSIMTIAKYSNLIVHECKDLLLILSNRNK